MENKYTWHELKEKVESIPDSELAEKAHKIITELCQSGGRTFKMTVPVSLDDSDIILSEVVARFKKLTSNGK